MSGCLLKRTSTFRIICNLKYKYGSLCNNVNVRAISLSAPDLGKRNFRKFHVGNKRGSKFFREHRENYPDIPIITEVKDSGYKYGKRYIRVPEMIPEFIVPDLTDCKLKPYVSYRVADIKESEFTPEKLFEAVYLDKILDDYKNGKLDAEGNSLEPDPEEKLTPEKAYLLARKTGSDIFTERKTKFWECLETPYVDPKKKDIDPYSPSAKNDYKSTLLDK